MTKVTQPKVVVLPSFYPMKYHYARGNFFEEQTRLLRKKGSDIAVVFNENRSMATFKLKALKHVHFQKEISIENDIPVLRQMSWNVIPTRYKLGRKLWVNTSVRLVNDYLKIHGKPDLFHVHCAYDAGLVALHFKDELRIPYILTEHSSFFLLRDISEKERKQVQDIYGKAEKVIVVSKSFRDVLADKLELDKNNIDVIPNFIDTDYFTRTSNADGRVVKKLFTVCHHTYNKRLDRLLHAFRWVTEEFPDLELVIGGEGAETEKLKGLARQLGLHNKVIFQGFLNKEQVRANMNDSDLFVLSSDAETFGVVLIEAMAMGLPVVATDCGGPSDIITSETGLLAARDAESLAHNIRKVISAYDHYDKDKIRRYAVDNFSGRVVADRYMELYNYFSKQIASH